VTVYSLLTCVCKGEFRPHIHVHHVGLDSHLALGHFANTAAICLLLDKLNVLDDVDDSLAGCLDIAANNLSLLVGLIDLSVSTTEESDELVLRISAGVTSGVGKARLLDLEHDLGDLIAGIHETGCPLVPLLTEVALLVSIDVVKALTLLLDAVIALVDRCSRALGLGTSLSSLLALVGLLGRLLHVLNLELVGNRERGSGLLILLLVCRLGSRGSRLGIGGLGISGLGTTRLCLSSLLLLVGLLTELLKLAWRSTIGRCRRSTRGSRRSRRSSGGLRLSMRALYMLTKS